MSEYLVVRLAEAPGTASWIALTEHGQRLSQTRSGTLAEAAAQARGRKVFLLLPGLEAITTRVVLPARRSSRIQQMLPYSLEDFVADDVDTLMFAAGTRRADGSFPVAIVARDLLGGWLADCNAAGLAVDAVFADVQGVPETPGNLTLLLEEDRVFGRLPGREAFVLEGFDLHAVLEMLAHETDDSADLRHIVIYADETGHARHAVSLDQLRSGGGWSIDVQLLSDGLLPRLAATFIDEPGSDLLQGPYKPKSDWMELARPWRTPAALTMALVFIAVGALAGRYLILSREDQALTALLESSCAEAFQVDQLTSCEQEIRSRMASLGGPLGDAPGYVFLEALGAVAGARDPQTQMQQLSFRDRVMNLRITTPNVVSLDTFVQAVEAQGPYQVDIQSTNQADNGVEGRIQIAGQQQ
jgi:general secretion pathway protein L